MSGLAGILTAGGEATPPAALLPEFEQMMASLAHRGRDAIATWKGDGGVLGALALHSTPESASERQPLEDAESGLVIVWDGRLDNRGDLLPQLASPGEQPGDATLVLRAFAKWNENSVPRLLGDFAFAVWDSRHKNLFAARDALGLKPFFYSAGAGRFYFASEVQALARLPSISPEPDDETIGEFLLGWTDFPRINRTFYRQIERLPPAHVLRWSTGRLEVERYWRVDPRRRERYASGEDCEREFGHVFTQAVECRLRSSSPVAVFLSAGLDSGAVCAAAARLRAPGTGLQAYSVARGDARDESAFASKVSQEMGVTCSRVPLAAGGDLAALAARLARHASPFFEEGWMQEENLLQRAARDGARVVLTGDGGDELFNDPWAYVADLVRTVRWAKLLRELRSHARYYQKSPLEALRSALPYLAPARGTRLWRRLKSRQLPAWIDLRFADRIGLAGHLREVRARLPFDSVSADTDHHALTRGRTVLMHEQREWTAAQQGLEYRFPFYDRRLIEFLLAIPYQRKSEGGQPKSLLRSVPGLLPASLIAQQEKADDAGLAESSLRSQLGEALRILFEDPPHRAAAYIRPGEARKFCREFLDGADNQQKTVWLLSCFFLWIQNGPMSIKEGVLGKERRGEERGHPTVAD
jgi:asparagine synthase (glutamine-hydrolysing)